MRLRPSGRSGMLVSSLSAFDRYQREDAWTWEHQALLRSRAVAGSPEVCAAFDELRRSALVSYVRRDDLRKDVADMRKRMRQELAQGTAEDFDLKQDVGGIADIEFIVQFLVLQHAADHPELVRYSDNIRQLEALVAHSILPPDDARVLTDAYRAYRERTHHLSLADAGKLVPRTELADEASRVAAIWQRLLG